MRPLVAGEPAIDVWTSNRRFERPKSVVGGLGNGPTQRLEKLRSSHLAGIGLAIDDKTLRPFVDGLGDLIGLDLCGAALRLDGKSGLGRGPFACALLSNMRELMGHEWHVGRALPMTEENVFAVSESARAHSRRRVAAVVIAVHANVGEVGPEMIADSTRNALFEWGAKPLVLNNRFSDVTSGDRLTRSR